MSNICIAILSLLMLVSAGCQSTSQTNDPLAKTDLDAAREIGSARVWYRIHADDRVQGHFVKAKARDQMKVLINESHSGYNGLSSENMGPDEYMLSDSYMLQMLKDLEKAGMFKPEYGARRIQTLPTLYVQTLARKPHKWIAVEQNGAYTWLEQPDGNNAPQREDDPRWPAWKASWEAFQRCEALIVFQYAGKTYGKGVSGGQASEFSRQQQEQKRLERERERMRLEEQNRPR